MNSTEGEPKIGGYRREVDHQKLGPALLIASSLVLAIRTARWPPTHSDGLSHTDWSKEVEHSVRIAKIVLSHLTSRSPELFQIKNVLGTPQPMKSPHDPEPGRYAPIFLAGTHHWERLCVFTSWSAVGPHEYGDPIRRVLFDDLAWIRANRQNIVSYDLLKGCQSRGGGLGAMYPRL